MIEFIRAEDLKRKFGVFGHFYSVQVAPKQLVECRSVLEIVESEFAPQKSAALSGRKPDAVFIMMNPGSSRPLGAVDNCIHADAIHELAVSLVPTKPDTTQYQVMRLMHHCGWRHVRVLNLSDLRCPKSGLFFKQFKGVEEDHLFDAHSVFSERRADELAMKLIDGIPVVCAWGVTGRDQNPSFRDRDDLAIGGSDGVRRRARAKGICHPWFVAFCSGFPNNTYAAVPTMTTCNTTTHQNTITKDSFFVLWRKCRCPSNAPGQPPNRARMCKVCSGTRRLPLAARRLSQP